jgi:dUTP pyrophosphatase
MKVRITTLRDDVTVPVYQTAGSAGFDLAAAEDMTIEPHRMAMVPTGLVIATPPGHVLILAARSSLFKKKGLVPANGIGVVDSDYCGASDEIRMLLLNMTDQPVTVDKGERLMQGIIVPFIQAEFESGQPLAAASRGGIGSTG